MPKNVPNLHTLVLSQNNLTELSDLDALQGFTKLTHLSLVGNPVASKEASPRKLLLRSSNIPNMHNSIIDTGSYGNAQRFVFSTSKRLKMSNGRKLRSFSELLRRRRSWHKAFLRFDRTRLPTSVLLPRRALGTRGQRSRSPRVSARNSRCSSKRRSRCKKFKN